MLKHFLDRLRSVLFPAGIPVGGATAPAQPPESWHDTSPHRVRTVTVDRDVQLEVLDWDGPGRPMVLLAGLGNTAHVFDDFAPKLARDFHVYGITRRGFGASSIPTSGYDVDRLADDVLAVIDTLGLVRPVLVGHSIAGDELTSLGARYSDRIGGLVYLDAAYDRTTPEFSYWNELAVRVEPAPPTQADLQSFQAMHAWCVRAVGVAPPEADQRNNSTLPSAACPLGEPRTPARVPGAIKAGLRKPDFDSIRVPALALYAGVRSVRDIPGYTNSAASHAAFEELLSAQISQVKKNSKAFRASVRNARVVEIPGANHYIYLSNEAEVLRELVRFAARDPARVPGPHKLIP